ncbi:MAG: 4Fe-4S dicluster domain-containing protein [Dehalococcoidales bacterium]|nr:4Fe-4S dicluster domain-containing protein [Dehalococcoidales bacterium]
MVNPKSTSFSNPVTSKQIEEISGENIATCYQCEKCTNGCPLSFAMDIFPHRVIHSIHLGLTDDVINSDTIWVCASCQTCTTRCPNGIDIAHVMDTLRQLSAARGVKPSQKQAPVFHRAFLSNVKRFGKMHEMSMALDYTLRSEGLKGLSKQARLGMTMLRKRKMKLVPGRLSAGKEVKEIFRNSEER